MVSDEVRVFRELLRRIGLDWFVLLMFLLIFAAWVYPDWGATEGPWSLSSLAHAGLSAIFFFYGLKLRWDEILAGLKNYKLHCVVTFATFILFPVLLFPVAHYFGAQSERRWLWIGVFFLGSLPSTVSSSVVMVNIARGNLPGAIFNASLSSLLGVFITPVWMHFFITAQTDGRAFSEVISALVVQVIVPIVLGVSLHRFLGKYVVKHSVALRRFDQFVILLIIYTSFCHSFHEHMFDGLTFHEIVFLGLGMGVLFCVVYNLIRLVCFALRFNREDRITALFCGSKKSLVHGTVMSQVLVPNPHLAGVMILPTMVYHALQLIIVSILASRLGKKVENAEKTARDT